MPNIPTQISQDDNSAESLPPPSSRANHDSSISLVSELQGIQIDLTPSLEITLITQSFYFDQYKGNLNPTDPVETPQTYTTVKFQVWNSLDPTPPGVRAYNIRRRLHLHLKLDYVIPLNTLPEDTQTRFDLFASATIGIELDNTCSSGENILGNTWSLIYILYYDEIYHRSKPPPLTKTCKLLEWNHDKALLHNARGFTEI